MAVKARGTKGRRGVSVVLAVRFYSVLSQVKFAEDTTLNPDQQSGDRHLFSIQYRCPK